MGSRGIGTLWLLERALPPESGAAVSRILEKTEVSSVPDTGRRSVRKNVVLHVEYLG